jgi:hypothetical protein
MTDTHWNETFVTQHVTYIVQIDDQVIVVEHVPARVNVETGERLFAPETVERLHDIVRRRQQPVRVVSTPIYEFAA